MSDNEFKNTENENHSTENNEQNNDVDTSRRQFIKNTGIAAGGVVGGAIFGGLIGNPFKKEQQTQTQPVEEKEIIDYSETRQFFKRKEDFDVLSIATERIYPEDEHGPGAIGLGVPYFIDKQLAGPWGKNAEDYMKKPFTVPEESPLTRQDIFLQGLRKMNEISEGNYGEAFYDLEEDQQIEILEQFENDEVDINLVSSASFFALLRQSTLEGCYSDPMYGGNKNMEGWKMKEYPGPRIAYIDMVEEEEFVLLEPVSLKTQK